jgi:biopolymer transport protein ExbD
LKRNALRYTAFGTLALAASHFGLAAYGQASSSPATDAPSVFIEVQADGQSCVIRKASVPCSEVLTHLRQVLKLAPGTWVRFKAGRTAPIQTVKKLLDDISHSEFATSASYLENQQRP